MSSGLGLVYWERAVQDVAPSLHPAGKVAILTGGQESIAAHQVQRFAMVTIDHERSPV